MSLIHPDGSYVIYIESPEHCEKVQRRLFELGYGWCSGGRTLQQVHDSHRIFLNYNGGHGRTLTYVDNAEYPQREGLLTLRLEDLYDTAEPPPPPSMKIKPTSYSKWHIQCLAKHILAKYPPWGLMRDALQVLVSGAGNYTEKRLLDYALRYEDQRHASLPKELLNELQRRHDA